MNVLKPARVSVSAAAVAAGAGASRAQASISVATAAVAAAAVGAGGAAKSSGAACRAARLRARWRLLPTTWRYRCSTDVAGKRARGVTPRRVGKQPDQVAWVYFLALEPQIQALAPQPLNRHRKQ